MRQPGEGLKRGRIQKAAGGHTCLQLAWHENEVLKTSELCGGTGGPEHREPLQQGWFDK